MDRNADDTRASFPIHVAATTVYLYIRDAAAICEI